MWLGMFAALLDVFHFSVQVLSVRTRALTKMFLQLLICTLQLQKGNKQTARWTLEEAQKIIILHRPKQSRYISSISSIFLASPYPYQRTWMPRLRSWRGPLALYDDYPGEYFGYYFVWFCWNSARVEDPLLCPIRRVHPVSWRTFRVPQTATALDCVR